MFLIQKVDFEFKIIEVYLEDDALILILLGKVRISYWKATRDQYDYRWENEGGFGSSPSDDRD
jgi:hypothetical protein